GGAAVRSILRRFSRVIVADTPFRAEEHSGPSPPAELLRQAHPLHEILESRLGSNLIELRVRENPAVNGPFRARLLEPLQCAVALAEAFINDGDVVGRNVPSLRSEEHTSELQSLTNIVCRLLLEK